MGLSSGFFHCFLTFAFFIVTVSIYYCCLARRPSQVVLGVRNGGKQILSFLARAACFSSSPSFSPQTLPEIETRKRRRTRGRTERGTPHHRTPHHQGGPAEKKPG